jgi:hypothetical protein
MYNGCNSYFKNCTAGAAADFYELRLFRGGNLRQTPAPKTFRAGFHDRAVQ